MGAQNCVPDRTAYRWATEPKVRAKIKAYRRRALDRAVGRLAGMVQIVCFGGNMLWRHMKVAFRTAKGGHGSKLGDSSVGRTVLSAAGPCGGQKCPPHQQAATRFAPSLNHSRKATQGP